ncbi:MAG TPA: hypothetical protein VMX38_17870 [Verrucomicrobiae bacterium]|jgi:hypothetical protein|nr:hypothetical protein [Verrucomicrobiae bacterium]
MKRSVVAVACFFLFTFCCFPAWGANISNTPTTNEASAVPGTLNYVEGQASIGNAELNSKSVGSAQLQAGQTIATQKGKAEILLTPGVFLRVGNDSVVQMISPSLTDTELALYKGHAMIEAAEMHHENDILIKENGATIHLEKTGLYDFNARQDEFRVFDGKASVQDDDKNITVKKNHELQLQGGPLKTEKFDKNDYEQGDLYRWSSLRSAYLAEANVDAASMYAENYWGPWGGWGDWWGAGWYWDPYFSAFTFMPGDGIFYSPFGWGFYSPYWVYDSPMYGWFNGAHGRYHYHFGPNAHAWGPGPSYIGNHYAHGVYRGPGSIGRGFHASHFGMRSGARGIGGFNGVFHGGGFHGGGMGGFHGGGMGGFHGGGGMAGGHGR